ncbi:MAG: leucine--tRNA ligase [Bacteroidota bacterium]
MEYIHGETEKKWQQYWKEHKTFRAENKSDKPKYYVLDMFPYPSGAGLHVGHPLGYIASDIYSRYKRQKGFNVLHPMGYDAFGLPAEQYAIQTGQHPAITTEKNIARYREQLDKLGFSFDWDREVRTCEPSYYKWTQWTFIQLFNAWYDKSSDKARTIAELISSFAKEGNAATTAATSLEEKFTAAEWNAMNEVQQNDILMHYRLVYLADTMVNWCPALGTVLANDEVSEGFSVRGGHPVVRKEMKQWSLRITAYAERMLKGLETLDWSDSLKEVQRNWIGKSEGVMIQFPIKDHTDLCMEIFTTRPDTIFGVTYMTFAPEHEFVKKITTPEYKEAVENYITETKNRSERERMADVKRISGQFTGAYAINPFTKEAVQIWIGDYVLIGYGTGAVMAVPGHDARDWAFATHFKLPIKEVVEGGNIEEAAYEEKTGKCINSDFINGMSVKDAQQAVIRKVEEMGIGYSKINFRLRDAIFSRQRYWGEPFPVYYKNGMACVMDEKDLPLLLPEVDKYLPTETGEPPLARAKDWKTKEGYPIETSTMPGFAGSSAYYLRYMDPHNDTEYFSKEAVQYWGNVDLYIGGAEHATGHLMYARFWNMFLYDLGMVSKTEPFQKLINQGMIQGRSSIVYRIKGKNTFVSYNKRNDFDTTPIHVDVSMVDNDVLNTDAFRAWQADYANAEFITENGKFICGTEVEKMSKSLYNVVNPDELVERYGADTLRMYEMFLGPIEQHKPWDTKGIEGVFRFIKKLWRLYHDKEGNFKISEEAPTADELRVIHKTIKKIEDDIERFSFNTSVSNFMICVNELTDLNCNKRAILEPLTVLLASFAPHISEELYQMLGHTESVTYAAFPKWSEEYLVSDSVQYPVSFNGKTRFMIVVPASATEEEVRATALSQPDAEKWLQGKEPKKVIVVKGRIVNVVI